MKITPKTKIIDIIETHPELIEVLAGYNKHFELLKNPVMRKTFARFATVKHAAKVAGTNLSELIKLLNNAIGETVSDSDISNESGEEAIQSELPIKDIIKERGAHVVLLDVRDIMKNGGEPFNVIMQTIGKIKQGEALELETIFEPAPLYDVLKEKGFEHQTERLADGHYRIWFYRTAVRDIKKEEEEITKRIKEDGNTVYLDVKGLEPPQPMALILETIAKLDPSKTLVVLHERVPVFLYAKLDERGYKYETQEIDEHNVRLIITK